MEAVREPFNVNSLAQVAAAAALDDAASLKRVRRTIADGRHYLIAQLDRLKIRWVPSATNFLLLELGVGASTTAQALVRQGVIIREMSGWQLDGFLRVTIGTMAENRRFIQVLKSALGSRLSAQGKTVPSRMLKNPR